MKKVIACLRIYIYVDCPYCGESLDLLDESDTFQRNHNDDGSLLKQAFPDKGPWSDSHEKFECEDVTCSHCGGSFDVKGLDW